MLKGDYKKDSVVLHALIQNGYGQTPVSDLRFYDDVWVHIEKDIFESINNQLNQKTKEQS